jgi:hypothetical protein
MNRHRSLLWEHFIHVLEAAPLFGGGAGAPPPASPHGAAPAGSMYQDEFEKKYPQQWQSFPGKAYVDWTFSAAGDGSIVARDQFGSFTYDPGTRRWNKDEPAEDDSFTF